MSGNWEVLDPNPKDDRHVVYTSIRNVLFALRSDVTFALNTFIKPRITRLENQTRIHREIVLLSKNATAKALFRIDSTTLSFARSYMALLSKAEKTVTERGLKSCNNTGFLVFSYEASKYVKSLAQNSPEISHFLDSGEETYGSVSQRFIF